MEDADQAFRRIQTAMSWKSELINGPDGNKASAYSNTINGLTAPLQESGGAPYQEGKWAIKAKAQTAPAEDNRGVDNTYMELTNEELIRKFAEIGATDKSLGGEIVLPL
jgi:hypothetical protein